MADLQRKTENIYDKYNTIEVEGLGTRYGQYVEKGIYSIYNDTDNTVIWGAENFRNRYTACGAHSTATIDMTSYNYSNYGFIMAYNDASLGDVSIVKGSTVPDHYIPYWQHSLRKMSTATETIQSGDTIYANGQPISTYSIKGNTVQNGTPTPSNPVAVNGVGNKTANLYNYQAVAIGKYIDANGVEQTSGSTGHQILNHTASISVIAGSTYTFKIQKEVGYSALSNAFCWFDSNNQLLYRDLRGEIGSGEEYIEMSYTAPSNAAYLIINFRDTYYDTGMLNTGSTALDYEPYGYKIPILTNQTTTNIYIGDNPLRKSLDGTAYDTLDSNGTLTQRVDSDGSVLATPIVSQITVPSIPTVDGANTITIDTTVQPSEFSATWTGWHDAYVKEYDGTNWQ